VSSCLPVRCQARAVVSAIAGLGLTFRAIEFGATDLSASRMNFLDERARRIRAINHVFCRNDAVGVQVPEMVIEQLHAKLPAGLNGGIDSESLAFADQVTDRGGDDEELVGCHHTRSILPAHELLAQYCHQTGAQLY